MSAPYHLIAITYYRNCGHSEQKCLMCKGTTPFPTQCPSQTFTNAHTRHIHKFNDKIIDRTCGSCEHGHLSPKSVRARDVLETEFLLGREEWLRQEDDRSREVEELCSVPIVNITPGQVVRLIALWNLLRHAPSAEEQMRESRIRQEVLIKIPAAVYMEPLNWYVAWLHVNNMTETFAHHSNESVEKRFVSEMRRDLSDNYDEIQLYLDRTPATPQPDLAYRQSILFSMSEFDRTQSRWDRRRRENYAERNLLELDQSAKMQNRIPALFTQIAIEDMEPDEDFCRICCFVYGSGDEQEQEVPVKLPCNHIYGRSCIKRWVETEHTCPTCRRDFADDLRALVCGSGN